MMEDGAEGEIGDMLSMCNKHPFFDDDDSERFMILYEIFTVFDEPVEEEKPSSAVIVYEELIVRTAFADGYTQNDKDGNVPEGNKVKFDGDETVMKTDVDCEKLVKDLNEFMEKDRQMYGELEFQIIEESERNLDGYAYFSFLKFVRCGNIHLRIPPLEGSCTKEVIIKVIERIMQTFGRYC